MDVQANSTVHGPDELERLLQGSAAALFDALMAHVPIGITIAHAPDVEIMRVSDAGSELLQRTRASLEGIPAELHSEAYRVSDPRTGEVADAARLPLTRATKDGEVVRGEEWVVTTADGRPISILCNAGPIRDEHNRVVGGIVAWTDMTRQKQLEMELRSSLDVRETLLTELHHRVKNHLQIVGSLVQAEGRGGGEEARALAERLQQRLSALADSYDALQRQERQTAAADEFLRDICEPLVSGAVALEVNADPQIEISGQAVPILGIIVNEAVCNAIKHAFPDDRPGRLTVSLRRDRNGYRLEVSDDGIGPHSGDAGGKGTELIGRLARQLGGAVELRPNQTAGATLAVSLQRL